MQLGLHILMMFCWFSSQFGCTGKAATMNDLLCFVMLCTRQLGECFSGDISHQQARIPLSQSPYHQVSQSVKEILPDGGSAPLQINPTLKKTSIVSVCACRPPGWRFLQSVNRLGMWHHALRLIPPSLLHCIWPISAQGDLVTWESPPVSVTMTTSTGPGSILMWWEEEERWGGRRRQEEREKGTRKGRQKDNNPIQRNSFWMFSLFLPSLSTVSTLPLLASFTCCTASKWKEICCCPLSSELDNVTWQMPLKISGMTSVIPLWCWECVQPASP